MTHLYCVLPHHLGENIPAGVTGVAGSTVRALTLRNMVAWVSDGVRSAGSIDAIRAHNDVVEAAMTTGSTPIPVRYGQRFENDQACVDALIGRGPCVEALLTALQGCVEMTILVTPSTRRMLDDLEPLVPEMFDPAGHGVGRQYLRTLRKREARSGAIHQASEAVTNAFAHAVAPFVIQTLEHQTTTPMPLRTVSHLILRSDIARYNAAVTAGPLARGIRLLVIGPRAPYAFCAFGAEPGGEHGMNLAG